MVKRSGARSCRIALIADEGSTELDVLDDGRGTDGRRAGTGTGLDGLADRIRALGGTMEIGPSDERGFRVRVRLGATPRTRVEIAR